MNIVAIFGILTSLCFVSTFRHCDQLPWKRDVNLMAFNWWFSGRHFLYKTVDPHLDVCSVGYCEQLRYTDLVTLKSPYGCGGITFKTGDSISLTIFRDAQFEIDYYTDGIWDRLNLQTGVWQERRVFSASGGTNGGSLCIYTCNGHETESFDCYVTSREHTTYVDRAIKAANLSLPKGQPWFECNPTKLPATTIPPQKNRNSKRIP